jgi:hypothetical protein
MVICFDGHCFEVVVISWWPPKPGPGPINYPALMYDATLVASMEAAAHNTHKDDVTKALLQGISAAKQAMQQHAGKGVEIHDEFPSR